jgi:hypothetical protein
VVLGVLIPPCVVCEGGSCQSWECLGAVSGDATCARAGFDEVDRQEMVRPLDNVQVELSEDACGVESCFQNNFVWGVGAERGEFGNGGGVEVTCAAYGDGENVDGGARLMLSNSIG